MGGNKKKQKTSYHLTKNHSDGKTSTDVEPEEKNNTWYILVLDIAGKR